MGCNYTTSWAFGISFPTFLHSLAYSSSSLAEIILYIFLSDRAFASDIFFTNATFSISRWIFLLIVLFSFCSHLVCYPSWLHSSKMSIECHSSSIYREKISSTFDCRYFFRTHDCPYLKRSFFIFKSDESLPALVSTKVFYKCVCSIRLCFLNFTNRPVLFVSLIITVTKEHNKVK